MSFTRNLIFRTDANTIQGPVTIMATFEKINGTPGLNQVAWRVFNYGGGGQTASAVYQQTLMFASIQITEGNIVTASASQALGLGQQTTLVASGPGVIFEPPTAGTPGELVAANQTGRPQGLAVGYLDSRGNPQPLLAWENVGNTLSVQAEYTPVLKAYVTAQYQQTEIIRGQITSPVLLTQNLSLLGPEQVYTLKKNPDGSFAIVADTIVASDA